MKSNAPPYVNRVALELLIIIACSVVGVATLLDITTPLPVSYVVNHLYVRLWASSLVLGAVVMLVGMLWPHRVLGLLMEKWALLPLGAALLLYGALVLHGNGRFGITSAALIFLGGCSCFVTSWNISKFIADLPPSLRDLHE